MDGAPPIALDNVSYSYGKGELRKQILFDISASINAGEIVILTGPSGSGKTTLLTIIGALRSAQQGSIRVLGQELNNAGNKALISTRRQIGSAKCANGIAVSWSIRTIGPGANSRSARAGRACRARPKTTVGAVRWAETAGGHRARPRQQAENRAGG